MTTTNLEAAARNSFITVDEARRLYNSGGKAAIGRQLHMLDAARRDEVAAMFAVFGTARDVAHAREFVQSCYDAFEDDDAPAMPGPVAILRKLHELAETTDDRKPYARAAAAVVEGIEMTRDADGLHVASQSEAGKQHTVNHHGCNCKARGVCLHTALWEALVGLSVEV